jgi:hypothetical protein
LATQDVDENKRDEDIGHVAGYREQIYEGEGRGELGEVMKANSESAREEGGISGL